jgi:hypothetical protein
MTACERCGKDAPARRNLWCVDCEVAFHEWKRRHATDVMWVVLASGLLLAAFMALPILGFPQIIAGIGAITSWGTILGASRLNAKRRRRQFLAGDALPRAYLPAPK